jgi:putative peptidoglycan lipid II flippase
MVAFILFGDLLIGGIYQRGSFLATDTPVVYAVLAAYALGLVATAGSRVLSSAFYALRDTRTPARMAYLRVSVSLALGVALMFPLDRLGVSGLHYGAVGLALGSAVAAWIEYILLRRSLGRAVGPHGAKPGVRWRISVAVLVAGIVAVVAKWMLGSSVPGRDALVLEWFGERLEWLVLPTLAMGTALAFGMSYWAVASRLGVGAPLTQVLRRGARRP